MICSILLIAFHCWPRAAAPICKMIPRTYHSNRARLGKTNSNIFDNNVTLSETHFCHVTKMGYGVGNVPNTRCKIPTATSRDYLKVMLQSVSSPGLSQGQLLKKNKRGVWRATRKGERVRKREMFLLSSQDKISC